MSPPAPPWLFGPFLGTVACTKQPRPWPARSSSRPRTAACATARVRAPNTVAFGPGLALDALWTPLFFGAHWYGLALLDIALLWVVICLTVALFARVHRPAGLLLLPYWAWVSFATVLTAVIWHLN